MREKNVELAVCKFAKSKGWLCYKWASPAHKGVPDRLFFKGGDVLAIEFKAPGKKMTPLQDLTAFEIKEIGGIDVFTIDNVEEGKNVFKSRP